MTITEELRAAKESIKQATALSGPCPCVRCVAIRNRIVEVIRYRNDHNPA